MSISGKNENYSSPNGHKTCGNFTAELNSTFIQDAADQLRSLVIPPLFIFITVVGVIGNVLVVYVMTKIFKKHSMTDIYVINLAVADFLFLLTLPVWAIDLSMDRWIFGNVLCKVLSSLTYSNLYTSVFLLMTMSIDRWLAIVKVVRSCKYRKTRYARRISCLIWLSGFVITAFPALYREARLDSKKCVMKCTWAFPRGKEETYDIVYNVLRGGIGFFLPWLVISSFNGSLVVFLCRRKSSRTIHKKSTNKATKTVLGVSLCFFLCWLPNQITNLLSLLITTKTIDCSTFFLTQGRKVFKELTINSSSNQFNELSAFSTVRNESVTPMNQSFICSESFSILHLVTVCLGFSNSMMNPILYFFLVPKYRASLKSLFKRKEKVKHMQRLSS